MKRTPLKRKTPLKQKSPLKSTSGFKNKTLSASLVSKSEKVYQEYKAIKKPNTRHGLQGCGRSEAHVLFHSKVVELGCFACNHLRLETKTKLCVHHTKGRNKGRGDFCEYMVICLCTAHHDPSVLLGASTKGISVHHNKKLFVALVGTEEWCVLETFKMLCIGPPWITDDEWSSYLKLDGQECQEQWIVENR